MYVFKEFVAILCIELLHRIKIIVILKVVDLVCKDNYFCEAIMIE